MKTRHFSQESSCLTLKNNMIECVCKQKNHIVNPYKFYISNIKKLSVAGAERRTPNKYAVASAYKIFLRKTARRRKE